MTMNSLYARLPQKVFDLMQSAVTAEFATVSAQGVPIDTPTFSMFDPGTGSIDLATGLAYPAKAERARRNPKVGLLIEGMPDEPVISIAAIAAVRDADIEANAHRYIRETIAYFDAYSQGNPWSVARKAIWYWSRMFVCCQPQRILWWPSAAAMDSPPQRWEAPADLPWRTSDPAPSAKLSAAPAWPALTWHECAQRALAQGLPGHLTLLDDDGFPLPIRARTINLLDDGFELTVPTGAPWRAQGKATLSFLGLSTFVGDVRVLEDGLQLIVERMLPTLPLMADQNEIWSPNETTRDKLLTRLNQELGRRSLGLPRMPEHPPQPTTGSLLRAERMAKLAAAQQQIKRVSEGT